MRLHQGHDTWTAFSGDEETRKEHERMIGMFVKVLAIVGDCPNISSE